jgi:hypothetical protein
MDIVLIHGRGQAGRNAIASRDEWLGGLRKGFERARKQPTALGNVHYPFYGDLLQGLVDRLPGNTRTLSRGGSGDDGAADPFEKAFVKQLAARAGVDPNEALAELPTRDRGLDTWPGVHAVLRRIERKVPWMAEVAIGEQVEDVKAYISNAFIQSKVNELILPLMQGGPRVIISHSLGTVVAYTILANNPGLVVPLFVTAGSPLGIRTIQQKLPIPLRIPARRWLNISDPDDIVALYPSLDRSTFVDGIDNITDIDNGDMPHSIAGYLSDARVGTILAEALS